VSRNHQPSILHGGSDAWRQEKSKTSQKPGWEQDLLDRIHDRFPLTEKWITQVGKRMDHVQIRFSDPWEVLSEFPNPQITRVRWHVYRSISKEVSSIDMRISGDTGTLLILVRSPKSGGGYDEYIVCRRKFEPGANWAKVTEFERGYASPDTKGVDIGWELFRRHPGLEKRDYIKSVWLTMLEDPMFENPADEINKHVCSLAVVTLSKPMSKDELQANLTAEKLEVEYAEKRAQYPDLSLLTEEDLVSAPVVITIQEVADEMNAHSNSEGKDWVFGDLFSKLCWKLFTSTFRDQYGQYLPVSRVIPE